MSLLDVAGDVVTCAKVVDDVRCPVPLPGPGEEGYHSMRRYCDEHQPRSSTGAAKRRARLHPEGDETPPPRVVNHFTIKPPPAPKTSASDPNAVLDNAAREMLALVPMVLAVTGDDTCSTAMASAIPAIAHQLVVLSGFHPGLRKFLTPGESTGEALAWLGLVLAVSPLIVTVLAHHHLVSDGLAQKLATFAMVGDVLARARAQVDDVPAPV